MREEAIATYSKKSILYFCLNMVLLGIFLFALDTSAQTRFAMPGDGVNISQAVAVTVEKGVLEWVEDMPRDGESPDEYLERREKEKELRVFFEFVQPENR